MNGRYFSKVISLLIPIAFLLLTGCGKINDISIKSIDEVKLKGLKKNKIMLNLEVVIDNPNTRKISITDIEFKVWMNERALGDFRITDHVKLIPCSRKPYSIPVEIELITIADAFKLFTSGSWDNFLDRIEVEGYIKGKSFPVRRKITIARQPFMNLKNSL
ncbi:MAG: hypothetical protein WBI34_09625 [Tenuifilaceae bacterium]|jgi:LEA14-like dessication related protein|nr:hypothetical protein [Bacteroidota bacterium]NLH57320.1 hypothetical protein [Rikenellaceae bacterium]OQC64387.1 MAG: hypothetical protein BWX49_00737 [Bacteroidetes bacterium ADurb.Bin008]HOF91194.1 hypothetical protein [Tenuifilaceae bacterium]HOM85351.1 hypothetical protein [Tenuifilaceae bacterium]